MPIFIWHLSLVFHACSPDETQISFVASFKAASLADLGKKFLREHYYTLKRKFSTAPINDCQLSRQKVRQKISVIITNTNPPL